MDAIDQLSAYTYEVRHNPNCPSPFLIVTTGTAGAIGRPGNFIAYGATLDKAAREALLQIRAHERRRVEAFHDGQRDLRQARAMHAVRGVVWA